MCRLCNNHTKHGKPYCIKHIENMDYVKALEYDISKEIRSVLSFGPTPIGKIARECMVRLEIVKKTIKHMPDIKITKAKYNHVVTILSLR